MGWDMGTPVDGGPC